MSVKPIVFNIPGLGGSEQGMTYQNLKRGVGDDAEMICATYDNYDPEKAESQLRSQVEAILDRPGHKHLLLVGSSLGGYWAQELARIYKLPTVLLNPQLRPKMSPRLAKGADPEKLSKFRDFDGNHDIEHDVLLGGKDELVDPQHAAGHFKNHTFYPDEGHQFNEPSHLLSKVKAWIGKTKSCLRCAISGEE